MEYFMSIREDPAKYQEMIVFKIQDIGSFRGSMEIISNINSQDIQISFYREGIIIDVCSSDQKIMSHWEFYRKDLLSYNYNVVNVKGESLEPYTLSCKASDWHQAIKGESKKVFTATFSVFINPENMKNKGISLYDDSSNVSGVTSIATTQEMVKADCFIDYFKSYYCDQDPCVKVTVELYCRKVISKYQYLKCNAIKYIYVDKGRIKTIGLKDMHKSATMTIVDGGVDEENTESYSYSDEGYSIKLSLKNKNSDWMSKLPRLAHNSILKIYLKPEAPLIIETNVGHFGKCVFTFIDSSTQNPVAVQNTQDSNLLEWY